MRRITSILVLLMVTLTAGAHPWKPSHYVIVDTDAGVDDLKAICMLLSSPDVRLLGISVSDGFRSADEGYASVRSMLDAFHHEGLPVIKADQAAVMIDRLLKNETTPVTFISLGSLRTAADVMKSLPSFRKSIKQIIWTNDAMPGNDGFNYNADPGAALSVMADTIPLLVTGTGGRGFYDDNFFASVTGINTCYAQKVAEIVKSHSTHEFVYSAYDEMAPLLLHYPQLFNKSGSDNRLYYTPSDIKALQKAELMILSGTNVKKMQVMKEMPVDTSVYMPDVQPYITDIVNKYGTEEWTSGVVANELHRHLGVFAIIGVKMGIRVREYFCTGVDEFHVTSYAGSIPPLSCMNDGIQVSTGATPGHGLLTVRQEGPFIPSAEFTYRGCTIVITLKKELADKMLAELKEINFVYGLDSNIYWELVRKNSLKYWVMFDRNEIFDIIIKE